ncbi:hypothetical protein BDD12DRAFT_110108 [Trichophaea hybrida]|nr:hypothetical protein BDD12DRAFT_110108 [Trichophaea hybrida]
MMEYSRHHTPYASMFTYLIFGLVLFASSTNGVEMNEAHYKLNASSYNPAIALLDSALTKASVADVLDAADYQPLDASDFMRQTLFYLKGFRWAQQSPADESNTIWQPQGISTSYDTGFAGGVVHGNSDVLIVSWNDERNKTGAATEAGKGVRVTFVRKGTADNMPENRGYIHALLVEPFVTDGKPDFKELQNVISGGIVWRGDWLFVTDDKLGVRVFDLTHIWKVKYSTGGSVGKQGNDYWGGEYPFVIPQARVYNTVLPKGTTFAPHSASLDRNSTPPCIMIGESTSPGKNSTFAKFQLDNDTNLFNPDSSNNTIVTAQWAWQTNIQNAKGLVFAKDHYFITSNDGDDVQGDLYQWQPGSWAATYAKTFPPGVQGISYKPAGDELWVVGNIPGKRYIMALNAGLKNSTNTINTTNTTETTAPGSTVTVEPHLGGMAGSSIAGVALGVLIGVCAVLVGILMLLKRRRQKAKMAEYAESVERVYTKPELGGAERSNTGSEGSARGEGGTLSRELDTEKEKHELPGKTERYELYSGETAKELPVQPLQPPEIREHGKWS